MTKLLIAFLLACFIVPTAIAQKKVDNAELAAKINYYKNDIRGPYRDIRWFCTDGSVRAPKDPCPSEIGPGLQHARYKDDVETIATNYHIYLGQLLAYTDTSDFWDSKNDHSRLKQYQLDKYLRSVDNGWINQKGQYYRGALQAEDEEAWGIAFYTWLLSQDDVLRDNYFFVRQSLKDVPHSGDDNLAQRMRSESKIISDAYTPFMDLRVKIHGQPEISDIEKVKTFQKKNALQLTASQNKQFDVLVTTMTEFFKPIDIKKIGQKASLLKHTPLGKTIENFIAYQSEKTNDSELISAAAQALLDIRNNSIEEKRPMARLQLLDVSLKLEEILFKNASKWQPETLKEQLRKIQVLTTASAGAGYLELWEYEQIKNSLNTVSGDKMTLAELNTVLETARGAVEWSAAMVKANYQHIVDVYTGFEPKAYGFIDDRIRGSIALHLGKSVGELGDFIARESAFTNKVMDIANQSTVRGLNSGYALGELVVVAGSPDDVEVSSDKIFIFMRSPADLKPVAGIATVAEGNMVSHVQLLARNLGIPNAALSGENLQSLQKYDGQRVFYAVSNKGNVILKPEAKMTAQERDLFAVKERNTEKIEVPIEKIRLDNTEVLNLRSVDANDSGQLCGPKAANLGQLKKMFPDKVVEGLVIPFGIFRQHMNQPMPGQSVSYWEFLNLMFDQAEKCELKKFLNLK